jgi:hypothetical protein
VPTGFEAKTKVKTSKHPSLKDFIFYASHFLPIWPKPKVDAAQIFLFGAGQIRKIIPGTTGKYQELHFRISFHEHFQ